MRHRHFNPDPRRAARFKGLFGVLIAGVGVLLLLQMMHLLPSVMWSVHFGWPLILIVVGLVTGLKSGFRNPAAWILLLIGSAYMVPSFQLNGVSSQRLVWPAILILAGLFIVLKRGTKPRWMRNANGNSNNIGDAVVTTGEDSIDIDATFCGRKEIITSKTFRGGNVNASFSGVEINLAAADSHAPIVLHLSATFAGIELIVPAHWEVQNEVQVTMGSVEDERRLASPEANGEKRLLVLEGTCTFGSVEIKSY